MPKKLLVVIDFEATCDEGPDQPGVGGKGTVEPRSEIIEIGAAMLSLPSLEWAQAELETQRTFQTFVKPKNNGTLSAFCKNLTHIGQEDVDNAPSFPDANIKMFAWMTRFGMMDDILFCSWGRYDMSQMKLDCELNQAPYVFDNAHLNAKTYACAVFNTGRVRGLKRVLAKVGMPFEGTPHRAVSDALMTAKLLQRAGYKEEWAMRDGLTYEKKRGC